jgi:hypothetical protein
MSGRVELAHLAMKDYEGMRGSSYSSHRLEGEMSAATPFTTDGSYLAILCI